MKKEEIITIHGIDFVDYQESDLRFTGWEDECVIINRSENHYLIPVKRLKELRKQEKMPLIDLTISRPGEGVSGCAGGI